MTSEVIAWTSHPTTTTRYSPEIPCMYSALSMSYLSRKCWTAWGHQCFQRIYTVVVYHVYWLIAVLSHLTSNSQCLTEHFHMWNAINVQRRLFRMRSYCDICMQLPITLIYTAADHRYQMYFCTALEKVHRGARNILRCKNKHMTQIPLPVHWNIFLCAALSFATCTSCGDQMRCQ